MRRPCSPRTSCVWVARMTVSRQLGHSGHPSLGELTDVGNGGSDADFDARVTLLSEFTLEEFVQFSIEDTVGDELPLLGDCSSLCSSHDCVLLRNLPVRDREESSCRYDEVVNQRP